MYIVTLELFENEVGNYICTWKNALGKPASDLKIK